MSLAIPVPSALLYLLLWHANKIITGLHCGTRHLAPLMQTRCYARIEATAVWLIAGLYKLCTLLFLSLIQLNVVRTHRVVADLQLQG